MSGLCRPFLPSTINHQPSSINYSLTMAATIIDGRAIAQELRQQIREEAAAVRAQLGVSPRLAFVLIGDDPAARAYVTSKSRAAAALGIEAEDHPLPVDIQEAELLRLIEQLNRRPEVHGILVQMPLPAHIDSLRVLEAVDPMKDVDGFHPMNVGRLVLGSPPFPPCTPAGIMALLRRSGVPFAGAEAVVVGRSNIVGKPVAMMLMHENATITICHSRTRDLPAVCRRGDILIVAIGRARLVTAAYVKPGAAVIDVGNSYVDGKVVGDVDFDSVAPVAGYISPVPGGVGPMTITMLLRNTVRAAQRLMG
jgi:methylenetetrahydrofolate dehydrogenase (NADP+)/methenyltetrahydrofolate cyclohydrolase